MPDLTYFLAADLGTTLEKFVHALKSIPGLIIDFITYFGHVPGDQLIPSLLVGAVFGALMTAIVYLVARRWLALPQFSSRAGLTAAVALVMSYSRFDALSAVLIGAGAFVGFVYLYEVDLLGLLSPASRTILLTRDRPRRFVMSALRAAAVAVTLGVLAYVHTNLPAALGIALVVLLVMAYLYGENLRTFLTLATLKKLANPDALVTLLAGGGMGAVVGAISSQILLYPTKHCTYISGVDQLEYRLGLLITVVSATFLLIPVWTWALRRSGRIEPSHEITSGNFRGFFVPYLLLVPTLIILVFFLYYPASQVVQMSLSRALLGGKSKFDCLGNYAKLVDSGVYASSFITTFQITLAIILLGMASSLGIAALASQKVRGAGIYRTWLIWPYAVSPVVTGVIFSFLFNPQVGPVNWALHELFGIRPQWFTNTHLAPWVVILASVWNSLGFNVLFYVAGLQNIPSDLLEAAAIDGANRFQRFMRITFPMLSPFTFFLLVTNVTYSFFGIFGAVDTLTQGGPWRLTSAGTTGSTNVLIYNLYQDAFEHQNKIGFAASQSLVLFLLVAGLTILQFRYVERQVTYGG